jgi:hypothetical protein
MSTKVRREIEPRWVSEYVLATYPQAKTRFRVPLGDIPASFTEQFGATKAARAYRPWRPEVDALIELPDRLILLEGKIFKAMDGLSKLPVYASMVPITPELAEIKSKPLEMHLLVVRALPWVQQAAQMQHVTVVEWAPLWIVQIWEDRDKYWAPEAVAARSARKQKLTELGMV